MSSARRYYRTRSENISRDELIAKNERSRVAPARSSFRIRFYLKVVPSDCGTSRNSTFDAKKTRFLRIYGSREQREEIKWMSIRTRTHVQRGRTINRLLFERKWPICLPREPDASTNLLRVIPLLIILPNAIALEHLGIRRIVKRGRVKESQHLETNRSLEETRNALSCAFVE